MTAKNARCSNCGERCVTRGVLPACNRCMPTVRVRRERYKDGGWAQCLVTIARVERWFEYDKLTA
ncbi:hypothetical protein SEA_ZARTROSA_59 [Arthrobacter phage Zartrosa]|uniref:Uncharacterized protein n=1 Tax=Arthrobacter phage Zartrosa TaxID=2603257 RepID=A0A5B8WG26_9CAUD|nr:hypothetical protein HYP98_gp59 [Arthrobacter phage Zartrosa]QED11171.1 hypothetical protein SEA_ZARTROSA_59 [Arthrobacter phage Zartrosa]